MHLNCHRLNIHFNNIHKILFFFYVFLFFSHSYLFANEPVIETGFAESKLVWQNNYPLALQEAKKNKQPILLYFSGSDWCGWCMKLKKEVFENAAFIQQIQKKVVCVEVDFPLYKNLTDKEIEQNKVLKEQFEINSYPTIVLIDPSERVLSKMGYLPGGAKKYGEFLEWIVEQDRHITNVLSDFNQVKYSSEELEELYKKAKEFKRVKDAVTFMEAGLKQPDNLFFLSEKYRQLSEKDDVVEAQKVKEELIQKDPLNERGGRFSIALTDFQRLSKKMQNSSEPSLAVKPLEEYILQFGSQDADNVWRIEMMVAQYFFDCNMLKEALNYAEKAYNNAPEEIRPEIKRSRDLIQSSLSATVSVD